MASKDVVDQLVCSEARISTSSPIEGTREPFQQFSLVQESELLQVHTALAAWALPIVAKADSTARRSSAPARRGMPWPGLHSGSLDGLPRKGRRGGWFIVGLSSALAQSQVRCLLRAGRSDRPSG
jgi:hypothetical protein